MVSIPVKMYTAQASKSIKFNQLTPEGNRVKQFLRDSVTETEVSRASLVKGYEFAKGQFVTFTAEELKGLEVASDKVLDIKEFVDMGSIDLLQVEKTYFLAPDKGGDKGFSLLARVLKAQERAAVAQWCVRGKEHLVVVRPYRGGLVLHQMYYADEVRDYADVEFAREVVVQDVEVDLASKLVSMLDSGSFDATQYEDTYRARIETAVEAKVNGEEIQAPTSTGAAPVGDLLKALEASLASGGGSDTPKSEAAPKAPRKPRKRASKKN
jgi:DNA end-binding protein Ku